VCGALTQRREDERVEMAFERLGSHTGNYT
jgi:hypothetical protein